MVEEELSEPRNCFEVGETGAGGSVQSCVEGGVSRSEDGEGTRGPELRLQTGNGQRAAESSERRNAEIW